MDDQRTNSVTSPRQDLHLGNESRTGSNATPIMTTTTTSPSSSVTPDSASALLPATPSDTDQDRTRELTMLKHEAFQELAIQTQRFDDLFIAKMAYWENLGPDEKTQWLERGRNSVEDLQQQHQHHNQSQGQGPTSDCMDHDEIDELVDALECRATIKDYSALIAFERQAELEKRRRSRMDASGLDAAELDTDSVYELGDMEVF
ncbi:hypothetical protein BG011_001855 [Mortierella polycephala]|uniref:Uncharacterized protein n=1 Tax=Mortierella polycephala TaxID=41804 RepID=A0A9P6PKG4_9FUNG|nr:hypothetical protein BG011_001855 [Mortierella polycephala]